MTRSGFHTCSLIGNRHVIPILSHGGSAVGAILNWSDPGVKSVNYLSEEIPIAVITVSARSPPLEMTLLYPGKNGQ